MSAGTRLVGALTHPARTIGRLRQRARLARVRVRNRWSRRPIVGDLDVVVSLTSYGHRTATVFAAIESIGASVHRPARFILWLDEADVLASPPAELRRLVRRGLEILPTENYGPHKKQYPYARSIEAHARPLVIADDDTFYPRDWLLGLVEAAKAEPDHVHGYRAHRITVRDGSIAPYAEWAEAPSRRPSLAIMCTGVGGVIYPPRLLDALRREGESFQEHAPRADDVWVHAVSVREQVLTSQLAAEKRDFPQIPDTQRGTLQGFNVSKGGNDAQIRATYGRNLTRLVVAASAELDPSTDAVTSSEPHDTAPSEPDEHDETDDPNDPDEHDEVILDPGGTTASVAQDDGAGVDDASATLSPARPTKPVRRRGLADHMLTTFGGNAFPAVVALATGPILAHALGVFGRGQVAAGHAPLALISTIATFGIPEAVTYVVAVAPALAAIAARRATLLLILTGLLGMGTVLVTVGWLSGGNEQTATLILISSLAIIPTLLVGVLRGVASANQQWRLVAGEKISASTLRLIVILILWGFDALSPLSATIVLAAMPVFGALAYIPLPKRLEKDRGADQLHLARTRYLASYGGRIWLGSISGVLLSRIDQTLMTGLSSAYALGLYVVAVTVSELPLIINSAVRDVTFATDAAKRESSRLAETARVSFVVCTLAALGLGVSMIWWLPVLFGEDFAPAIPVAALLLVAVALGTPGSIAGAGLSARGRPGLRSISLIVAAVVNVVLLMVLVPTTGAMGAAVATLVGNLLAANLNLVFLKRISGVSIVEFYAVKPDDVRTVWRFVGRKLRRRPR